MAFGIHWDEFRLDLTCALGEFIGTFVFLFLGLGGVQSVVSASGSSTDDTDTILVHLYIASSMGLSLLISAWMFYRATGAAFNPNVSFALLLIGLIKPVRFVLYCIAQFLGAIAATAILSGLTPGPLSVSPSLASGVSISQGLFIETFGSMILVLSVLLLAIEKHTSSFLAPVGIGLTLFAVHLFAVQFTGSGVNTARAFAPCVVTGKFEGYHWIYWVGPTLGAVLIDVIYLLVVKSDERMFKTKGGHAAAAVAIAEQARDLVQEDMSEEIGGQRTAGKINEERTEDVEKGRRA